MHSDVNLVPAATPGACCHAYLQQGAESATPSVRISAPSRTTIGAGVTLSGSVDATSVCSGDIVSVPVVPSAGTAACAWLSPQHTQLPAL